jgi:hypothetical protein
MSGCRAAGEDEASAEEEEEDGELDIDGCAAGRR